MDKPQYIRIDTAHEFTLSYNGICMPLDVQFTDQSVNPVSWTWSFGTGDTSYVQHPLYTYTDYTGMPIILAMTDVNGCRDTARSFPISPLLADFETSTDSGCVPFWYTSIIIPRTRFLTNGISVMAPPLPIRLPIMSTPFRHLRHPIGLSLPTLFLEAVPIRSCCRPKYRLKCRSLDL